jgi:NADH-quinone oxidoreductase subunit J
METFVFLVAAAVCLAGALGVILNPNPVHAALSLVATLFGVAVLFVAQEANFLAAVQVIVYAGAIVVLFLFVIMLLGVDRAEDLSIEPLVGQRVAAGVVGIGIFTLPVLALESTGFEATGLRSATDALAAGGGDLKALGRSLFTDYLYAFELTSVLLVIAVIGAVLLARRTPRSAEIADPEQAAEEAALAARLRGYTLTEDDDDVIDAVVDGPPLAATDENEVNA